jgi:hypothetical protein
MDTAKLVLRNSFKPGEKRTFKSYELIAAAWNDLTVKVGELTESTRDWLVQTHQINWSQPKSPITSEDIKLEILSQNSTPPSSENAEYLVPYRLTNRSKKTINRLSIFSIPQYGELESSEVLLGTIGPEESKSGVINLNAQHVSKPDRAILVFGVAIDAEPVQDVHQRIAIDLPVVETLSLSAFASLDDSESNGKKNACVEPGETVKVRLEIRNVGHVKGSNLKISVQNLNGSQVDIGAIEEKLAELDPGKAVAINFTLKGKERIFNSKLALGLTIEARQLPRRFQQVIAVTSQANAKGRNVLDYSSH